MQALTISRLKKTLMLTPQLESLIDAADSASLSLGLGASQRHALNRAVRPFLQGSVAELNELDRREAFATDAPEPDELYDPQVSDLYL